MQKILTDRIILIPYADIVGANTGVNISDKNRRKDIYLKNCCVSACSAKHYNAECTVAIVTNIEVPKDYAELLDNNGVEILNVPFDLFTFDASYTWTLAFYKLCALYHVVREYNYKYYAYMDTDVFVQASFSDVWNECDQNVMLYDINHGLQVNDYRIIIDEVSNLLGERKLITHFGGEFFAANRDNALVFSETCYRIYTEMREKEYVTTKGDEFILSIAASELKDKVKNASPYIYRFWTGGFRLISTCYEFNPVVVLHVPAEKESGIIKLFNKYMSKNQFPSNDAVYKLLHLRHPAIRVRVSLAVRKLIGLIKRR